MELAFNLILILLGLLFSLSLFAKHKANANYPILFKAITFPRVLILVMLLAVSVAGFFMLPVDWLAWLRTASLLLALFISIVYLEGLADTQVITMRSPIKWDDIILYGVYKKNKLGFGTKIYIQLKPTEAEVKEARAKSEKPEPRWMNLQFFSNDRSALFDFLLKKLGKEKQIAFKNRSKQDRR